jgi:ketol-acid reductoisomerase
MNIDEFDNKNHIIKDKNIVIVGCGAQGLKHNQQLQYFYLL